MKTIKHALILVAALSVSGCITSDYANKETAGMLVGAGLGGLLGSQFGQGSGQLAATAAGTFLGGALGNAAGRSLDRADASYAAEARRQALETAPSGSSVPWRNPDSGASGYIEPTATYETASGTYCREFKHTVTIDGKRQNAYGRACRRPDGTWQLDL